ncbi:MAG: hypothetical protein U0992_21810 [Planctomycetaceae bacterium]
MSVLAIAYGLAWAAVTAFVAWMGLQHSRLSVRLKELEADVCDVANRQTGHRAA